MSVRSALNLNCQVVPLIVERMARHSGGMPLLSRVVPNVPLIAAGDAALVPPNIGLAVHKLIDIELQCLRGADVIAKKICIIDKVMRLGVDAVVSVRHSLRRELADQMIIPKRVGIGRMAADIELHGFPAERGRTYALIT